ncbi:hypothetical protein OE88DRAFT_1651850 [Heliocybe sulcata]|uniref:Pheromone n=1 Tax=Heliocybe sulcata TaxID=5364 RepID=A0A5C3NDS5_9AGAM|nr:hypothetical protein OE88DRAFT_1651850 [Heliocybe sulcata]
MRRALAVLFVTLLAMQVIAVPLPHGPVDEVDCDADDIAKKRELEITGPGLALCF